MTVRTPADSTYRQGGEQDVKLLKENDGKDASGQYLQTDTIPVDIYYTLIYRIHSRVK
jgi:hypothetical protein